MTNVTPTVPDPVTTKQMAAALVLADILDHGLPAVHWTISDTGNGGLDGQIFRSVGTEAQTDAQERGAVRAFAEFLGTTVREGRIGNGVWTLIEATGTYEGVKVHVWASVDDAAAIAREAAALAAKESAE